MYFDTGGTTQRFQPSNDPRTTTTGTGGGTGGGSYDLGGLATAGVMAVDTYLDYKTAQDNLKFQKTGFKYQKALQKTMFAREDTAVQRRMEDLKRAGLSPVLAAGQSANAGPVVSTEVPQNNYKSTLGEKVAMLLNMSKMKEDISNTVAQRELLQMQKDKAGIEAAETAWNLKLARESGTTTNATGWANDLKQLMGIFSEMGAKTGPISKKLPSPEEIEKKYGKDVDMSKIKFK